MKPTDCLLPLRPTLRAGWGGLLGPLSSSGPFLSLDTIATLPQPSARPYQERPTPSYLLLGPAGATLHSPPGILGAWVSGDAHWCTLR